MVKYIVWSSLLNLSSPRLSIFDINRLEMADMMEPKVFDKATADDVALEQLGYQQGQHDWMHDTFSSF